MGVVLDSDVVVGFLDEGDALHPVADARLRKLLRAGESLIVSVVTYAELLTGVALGHHPEDHVRGFFGDLVSEIAPIDLGIGERAAQLRGQHKSLKTPDAFILATADLHPETDLVICGDRKWMKIRGLSCRVELLAS